VDLVPAGAFFGLKHIEELCDLFHNKMLAAFSGDVLENLLI
jgi:hypothetical protein